MRAIDENGFVVGNGERVDPMNFRFHPSCGGTKRDPLEVGRELAEQVQQRIQKEKVMTVRAKFVVEAIEPAGEKDGQELKTVKLRAVYDGSPENKEFFAWTPSGNITMSTVNPAAWKQFAQGDEFYVDFTKA